MLLFVQAQVDFWQADVHATGAIASAVCCGVGDERNAHFIQVIEGELLCLCFMFCDSTFHATDRLSDRCLPLFQSYFDMARQAVGKQIFMHQERLKELCVGVGDG